MISKAISLGYSVLQFVSNPTAWVANKAVEAARSYGVEEIRNLKFGPRKFSAEVHLDGEMDRPVLVQGEYALGPGYLEIVSIGADRPWANSCLKTLAVGKRLTITGVVGAFLLNASDL